MASLLDDRKKEYFVEEVREEYEEIREDYYESIKVQYSMNTM